MTQLPDNSGVCVCAECRGFDRAHPREGRQLDLFARGKRAARRVLMHAVDTGLFPDGADAARFECRRCHRDSGWIYATRIEARRGVPCPACNSLHTSSGEAPQALPLTDPDAPAIPPAGVSAAKAAQSRRTRSRPQPETAAP